MEMERGNSAAQLKLPTEAELEAAYREDLTASFPPQELKPLSHIMEMWRQGRYLPWCFYEGESGPIGECFLWLGEPGWALLDYLCVTPGWRNDGFGAAMLRMMRAKLPGTVILCESESPLHAPDPAMAQRRLGFYIRNGARLAGYDTELFGVHYCTLYWADGVVEDSILSAQHRFIYRDSFASEKFSKYVRIPRDPQAPAAPVVPWEA